MVGLLRFYWIKDHGHHRPPPPTNFRPGPPTLGRVSRRRKGRVSGVTVEGEVEGGSEVRVFGWIPTGGGREGVTVPLTTRPGVVWVPRTLTVTRATTARLERPFECPRWCVYTLVSRTGGGTRWGSGYDR